MIRLSVETCGALGGRNLVLFVPFPAISIDDAKKYRNEYIGKYTDGYVNAREYHGKDGWYFILSVPKEFKIE